MTCIPSCSICWDKFTSDCDVQATKCGHLFHDECIQRWLKSNSTCPECRQYGQFLYPIFLNFKNVENENSTFWKTVYKPTPEEIIELVLKLSLEEAKCKAAENHLLEKEKKLQEQNEKTEERESKKEKLIIFYKKKIHKTYLLLQKERKLRQMAEMSEEVLEDELNNVLFNI